MADINVRSSNLPCVKQYKYHRHSYRKALRLKAYMALGAEQRGGLRGNVLLADLADNIHNRCSSCGRTEERMRGFNQEKDDADITLPVNDAERWIAGCCAIWSEYCGGSCRYLGGYQKTKATTKLIAKVLREDWMVTDHDGGVDTLEYLLVNAGFDEDDEYDEDEYDEDGDEWDGEDEDDEEEDGEWDDEWDEDEDDEDDDDEDDDEYDEEWDEADTTAFDYACACNMCGRMLIAGYITREEAISYATEAAKKIQELYHSWEEYFEDYIAGAACGSNINERAPFEEAYEQVKKSPDSPMNLDWNTPL